MAKETKNASKEFIEETKKSVKAVKKADKSSAGGEQKIISIDGKLKMDTEEEKRKKNLLTLKESLKSKKIITKEIHGVEKIGKDGLSVAVIWLGDFKIIIPTSECIDIPDAGDRDKNTYEEYLLSKRLASEIDFIIVGIEEEKDIAVASRKLAMEKRKKEFLLETNKQGEYIVNEESVVEARIVCTNRAGIIVEIFGVESYIPSRELSYQRIQDAAAEYSVGQRIPVKILSITRDLETQYVEIEASLKQASPNPYLKAMKRYQVDDRYIGKVSMVDENGIFVALEGGIDVLCKYPDRGARPTRGTTVTVRITTKNEEMNRLFGLIVHMSRI